MLIEIGLFGLLFVVCVIAVSMCIFGIETILESGLRDLTGFCEGLCFFGTGLSVVIIVVGAILEPL